MNEKVNAYPVIECAPKFKGGTKRGALLESRLHSQNRGDFVCSKQATYTEPLSTKICTEQE